MCLLLRKDFKLFALLSERKMNRKREVCMIQLYNVWMCIWMLWYSANVHVCKGHRGTSGVYQSSLQRFLWDKFSHQNLELIFVLVWFAIKPTVSIFSLPTTGVYRTMCSKTGFVSVRKIWIEVAYSYKSVLLHWDISQSFHLLIF